jgi:hypothetical protein
MLRWHAVTRQEGRPGDVVEIEVPLGWGDGKIAMEAGIVGGVLSASIVELES